VARLVFKLFLNGDNAPVVLAWMAGLAVAYFAIRLAMAARRVTRLATAERQRLAYLARWREMFGCDPRSLSAEERSALAPWVSQ